MCSTAIRMPRYVEPQKTYTRAKARITIHRCWRSVSVMGFDRKPKHIRRDEVLRRFVEFDKSPGEHCYTSQSDRVKSASVKPAADNQKPRAGSREPKAGNQRPATNSGVTPRVLQRYNENVLTFQHAPRPRQFASARMLAALPRLPAPLFGSVALASPPQPLRKRLTLRSTYF